ncbi:MAG TPA: zinc ribbon domain-containing protein [Acidobacteriota bacterium]|nr:zinc ribbon domain-containing protein [Acidobacteriota bacterium]
MPIYEYRCSNCGAEFEKLVFNSSAAPSCPKCKSDEVKKRPSVFGFSSGGKMVSSSSNQGCTGCTSQNCSTCK